MKAEDKLQILKFLLMLVNTFFVILGVSLFGCSAWILFDKNNFIAVVSTGDDVKLIAGGLFVIGLVVVGVSLLGCVGAHSENRCFIAFYMGFLIAIALGQIFISFVLLLKRDAIEDLLAEEVDGIISQYGGNETQVTWSLLDSVQRSIACCGRINAFDWQKNSFIQSLSERENVYPCSCFNTSCPLPLENATQLFGQGTNIHPMGCQEELSSWLRENVLVIIGMDIGLLFIQVFQFVLGVYFFRNIGQKMTEQHRRALLNSTEVNPTTGPADQQERLDYDQHNHYADEHIYNQSYDERIDQHSYDRSYPLEFDPRQENHSMQNAGSRYNQGYIHDDEPNYSQMHDSYNGDSMYDRSQGNVNYSERGNSQTYSQGHAQNHNGWQNDDCY